MSETETHLEDIRRIAAVHYIHQGNPALSMSAMADDVIYHGRPDAPKTLAEWRKRDERFGAAMSEIETTIDRQVAEGDMVATQWRLTALHTGPLMNYPASGKRIEMKSMCFDRVANGKVVEHWGVRDLLNVLRTIGAVPRFDPSGRNSAGA